MANFKKFDPIGSTHGKYLQRAVQASEDADAYFKRARDTMVQMLEGDGSTDPHYTTIQTCFGFASTADAHAAFLILDTAYGKTSGDGSVTNSRAARDQMFSQLRS